MTAATMAPAAVRVRDAAPGDNAALIDLAGRCPMEGDMTLRVAREPDFFQLNRLEGARWRVGVAEIDGTVVGCVMAAQRHAYVHGAARPTLYAGDLKVDPAWRGAGVANALSRWVARALGDMGGSDAPILLTILAGNTAMERRTEGRGGMPRFVRFATIRVFSIPFLLPRAFADRTLRISRAATSDLEEMIALWRRVAPSRQLAPVLSTDSLARWIGSTPGLDITSYRLARDDAGRLVGFLAWWDQSSFKQLHVLRYSPRMRVARAMINGAARTTRGVPLPAVGAKLPYCTAVHVCVPGDSPHVLRALVRSSYGELRASRYAFGAIGLDVRDPLCSALGGLFAQPTDVNAHICTAGGDYSGQPLGDRPLHYEIALV